MKIRIKMKYIPVILLVVLLTSVTAVFADNSDTFSATVTLSNNAPVIYYVQNPGSKDPTAGTTTAVSIMVNVSDINGVADITDTMVNMTLSNANVDTNITDEPCTDDGAFNATVESYTCAANLNFWNTADTWTISIKASDASGTMVTNETITFTYTELEAWTMTPTSITWDTQALGATDVAATDDPIVLTNTGNHVLTGEGKVTALDLVGVTDGTYYIAAGNFSVNVADSQGGDAMVNNTATAVTGFTLAKGAAATEDLYFYIETVPAYGLIAQVYNSVALGEWTISSA